MIDKLKTLIEQSESILITSHISPDGDSVSSSLLLFSILKLNYPDKKISVSMEERPFGLDFLPGFEQIAFQPFVGAMQEANPDLLIVLDVNSLSRITRDPDAGLKRIDAKPVKRVVIDHHEGLDFPALDVHINNKSAAVTLDIYEIFLEKLGLKKPDNYAQIAMTGLYTDTGGFVYRNLGFKRVFGVLPKLIEDGADIEALVYQLNQVTPKTLGVLGELIDNAKIEKEYIYSYLSDKTTVIDNHEAIVQATDIFRTQFLRNVEGRSWGFIVARDVMANGVYSVSFRSQGGSKDVSKIAASLGGGGHKPAAGAKFMAASIEEALASVKEAVQLIK